jgi:hypothetical protein
MVLTDLILLHGVKKLGHGRRHGKALVQDLLLALEAHVLWPLHESAEVGLELRDRGEERKGRTARRDAAEAAVNWGVDKVIGSSRPPLPLRRGGRPFCIIARGVPLHFNPEFDVIAVGGRYSEVPGFVRPASEFRKSVDTEVTSFSFRKQVASATTVQETESFL